MEFDNSFEVPLPPQEAWSVLMDIRRIAPCMPGAELTEVVDPLSYRGKIAVRLGPVALAFAGLVTFEHIDAANHTARVKAQGSDAKGRGAANAAATFRLEPVGSGSKVLVHTDLALSGAVAQYGRGVGMIQATAAQIMGQFAKNLREHLAGAPPPVVPAVPSAPKPQIVPAAGAAPRLHTVPAAWTTAGPPPATSLSRRPANTAAAPAPVPQPPAPAAKPISGLSLIARVLWERFLALFKGRAQR
jgi:carbon monoxide dehydrogenase subunit G